MSTDNNLVKIKQLRASTGAGFKDCGLALSECNGDIEKSIEYLRIKGISKASKKMERLAKEGLVCVSHNEKNSSIIEINCETDFVAKNQEYQKFCNEISDLNLQEKGNIDKLVKTKMGDDIIVEENLVKLIAKIGEKISIGRTKYLNHNDAKSFVYIHNSVNENAGKLGVISLIKSNDNNNENFKEFGRKLSMHIAASNPLSIDENSLNKDLIEKEKNIVHEELKNSGKPENIIEKISKGRLTKFIQENTLLNQYWVMEPKKKVKEIMQDLNMDLYIIDFVRYKIGE